MANELDPFAEELLKMSNSERLSLAKKLKAAGYSVPESGQQSAALLDAFTKANSDATAYGARTGNTELKLVDFLAQEAKARKSGSSTASASTQNVINIYTDAEADAVIIPAFKQLLNREPTPDELKKIRTDLQAKQKNTPTKTEYKTVNGVTNAVTTGGLNAEDFINSKIQALPEFNEVKSKDLGIIRQDLETAIKANGMNPKDFPDLENWINAVYNGAKPDVYKNIVRATASVGMPENVKNIMSSGVDLTTVYSPYRNIMARVLELPDAAIKLDDPTLRSAIGPDKEMSIYDFEKSLRKDSRWQYTNNARESVADAALQVLRDFGFQA